jgi:hypothetical protein
LDEYNQRANEDDFQEEFVQQFEDLEEWEEQD